MRITIDTEKDSKETLKKVVALLQQVTGEEQVSSSSSGGFLNMFESSQPQQQQPQSSQSTEPTIFDVFKQDLPNAATAQPQPEQNVLSILGEDQGSVVPEEKKTTGFFELDNLPEEKKEKKEEVLEDKENSSLDIFQLEQYDE